MSIQGFNLTGNSAVCPTAHTAKMKQKHYNSALPIPYEENSLMTNGLAIQRASNAKKTLIMQFQDCRSTFVHQHFAKKHAKKNSQQWHHMSVRGFHHHWQLYCLFFNQCRKKIKKTLSLATLLFVQQPVQEYMKETTGLRTTDPLPGETIGDLWIIHTNG